MALKQFGPRPELTDEMLIEADVEKFYMYNPEGFLKYSKELLHTEVSEDTIKEVRDISVSRSSAKVGVSEFRRIAISAEKAVYKWVKLRYEEVEIDRYSFPSIIARNEDKKYGFDVKLVRNPNIVMHHLQDRVYRSYYEIKENDFDEISVVLVFTDIAGMNIATKYCARLTEKMPSNLKVIIGFVETDRAGNIIDFFPHDYFYAKENISDIKKKHSQEITKLTGQQAIDKLNSINESDS